MLARGTPPNPRYGGLPVPRTPGAPPAGPAVTGGPGR
jgi:hypothetical protein